jgi:hypothetical protein
MHQFSSLWYVRRKPCTYLQPMLTLSPNGPKWDSTWPMSPRSFIVCVQNYFLTIWYVLRKPWTYLAPTQTPYPNGPKQDSMRCTSPMSSIGCIQNDFWDYGTIGANHAHILRQDSHYLQTNQNELPLEPHHPGVPSGVSKTITEHMVFLAQTVHLSCTETNTISKWTEMRIDMTHVT